MNDQSERIHKALRRGLVVSDDLAQRADNFLDDPARASRECPVCKMRFPNPAWHLKTAHPKYKAEDRRKTELGG